MIETQQPPNWGPPGGGGYGPPPGGGGGYGGPPPDGEGYGEPPPGGGGYGGPPGGGGYGGPPPGGGGYGGPPPGGYGGPPPGGFGQPPYMGQVPGQSPRGGMQSEPMAIVSLVVGIISMPASFCCSFFGIPLSITAIILGAVSIGKINQEPHRWEGKGLAMAGIATGAVGIVLLVIFFFLGMAGALLRHF